MANKIVYTSEYYGQVFTFEDIDLIHGTMKDVLNNALVSETLSIDTASFTIMGRERGGIEPLIDENGEYVYTNEGAKPLYDSDGLPLYDSNGVQLYDNGEELLYVNVLNYATIDFTKFTYGDEIDYYVDDTLQGKYYLVDVSVAGDGSGETTFSMESLMGLLNDVEHRGGVYVGTLAGTIIADIMGDYPYTIDSVLANTQLNGWLPYDTCLANLTQVLFACGASVLKDANGDLEFTYNLPQTATVFDVDSAYLGGERRDIAPATIVKVTEHTFFASSGVQSEELFNNLNEAVADHYEIRFDQPYHSLVTSGLTINSSGANWAIVSGSGKLTGTPYLHIQRIRNQSTGVNAKANEKTAANCTLISSLNSDQVLARLASYYSQTQEIQLAILTDSEKPGGLISVPDPIDHSQQILGYIKGMKRTFSSTLKSEVTLTSNWVPGNVGNSYDSFLIVRKSDLSGTTWTVPTAIRGKKALVVLFGGAQGGQGGWYGESGFRVTGDRGSVDDGEQITLYPENNIWIGYPGSIQQGLAGGKGGNGGLPGKMIMFNISSLANSYTVNLGAGGAGGDGGTVTRNRSLYAIETDPADGVYGEHSTMNGYDTNDGVFIEAEFVNLITGAVITPKYGDSGIAGAKGGNGGASRTYVRNANSTYDYSALGRGADGESLGTYTGGSGADGVCRSHSRWWRWTSSNPQYVHYPLNGGGGGGGAANGGNGADGEVQTYWSTSDGTIMSGRWHGYNSDSTTDRDSVTSSNGGDGGNATIIPTKADLKGGQGGAGGGGGGGCGAVIGKSGTVYLDGANSVGWGLNGKGGNGAQGGQGSDGWFIVYYKA